MSSEHPDIARQASDPATDWHTLHWIAENRPELRAAVAANPSTYPELIRALGDLGDPDIDAAIAQRPTTPESAHQADAPGAPPAPADPSDPQTDLLDVVPGPGPGQRMPAPAWDAIIAPRGYGMDGPDSPDSAPRSPAPRPRAPEPAGPAAGAAPAASGSTARPRRSQYHRTRRGIGIALLAVVLPLAVLGTIGALLLNLFADPDGSSPDAPDQAASPSDQDQGADTSDDADGSADESEAPENDADDARAELQALADSSTCTTDEDADSFSTFAQATSAGDGWEQDSDAELLETALLDLQQECDTPHAAAVYLQLTNDDDTPDALGSALDEMGTDWADTPYPAGEAQDLTTFASPDGNVICEMGEAVRCRVLSQTFPLPEGCEDDTTLAAYADRQPGPDCENPVPQGDRPTLGLGQTAANDFFACTSFQSQMSCWNQLTGEGFNLQSARGTTY